jgi:hypothetical protein
MFLVDLGFVLTAQKAWFVSIPAADTDRPFNQHFSSRSSDGSTGSELF